MKPNRSKIKLNSLNVGTLGIEQSNLKDSLTNAVHGYMDWYLTRLHGETRKQSITMKSIQSVQSNLNNYRRTLGMAPINVIIFLKEWKLSERDAHATFLFIMHGDKSDEHDLNPDQVFEGNIHEDKTIEGEY